MSNNSHSSRPRCVKGFTLVEMLTVITIIVILVSLTASVLNNTDASKLRTAGESLTAMVEQGRTTAITRRKQVALAVMEPGQGGFDDGLCRLGLFEIEGEGDGGVLKGTLLRRWLALPGGIVFFGGEVDSLDNLMDEETISLEWNEGNKTAEMRALVFTTRGGLVQPKGSESVVVTFGRGTYKSGRAIKTGSGARRTIRIGRVVARPWILDS